MFYSKVAQKMFKMCMYIHKQKIVMMHQKCSIPITTAKRATKHHYRKVLINKEQKVDKCETVKIGRVS